MTGLTQDLRYGLRSLISTPGFTLVAIAALALGIGANTAIFSVVDAIVLKPLPYPDAGRIVLVRDNFLRQGLERISVSVPEFYDYRSRSRSFEAMGALAPGTFNLTGGGEAEQVAGAYVTAGLFDVLGIPPILGRATLDEEDEDGRDGVAVISAALWKRRFGGDPSAIGRTIQINSLPYEIVGVMPPALDLPPRAEIWIPLGVDADLRSEDRRGARFLLVVARLRDGVGYDAAAAEMASIGAALQREHPAWYEENTGWAVTLQPLIERMIGPARRPLYVLLGAVGFVLLIACANVANLLLSRGAARRREVAIRTALGAGRLRVARQLLTESLLLAGVSGAAGLLLGAWGIDLLRGILPASTPRLSELALDARVVGFALGASALCGLLFGLAPALQVSATDLAETLKESGRPGTGGPRRQRLRAALVVAEIALALVLLVGAGLMTRSLRSLLDVDPGFEAGRAVTVRVTLPRATFDAEPKITAFWTDALERVRSVPGVEGAGAVSILPLSGSNQSGTITVEDVVLGPDDPALEADRRTVTPEWFEAMGVRLLRGRTFDERDAASAAGAAIVDESFARRFWPDGEAVGRRMKIGGDPNAPWLTIVGVAAHVRSQSLDRESRIQVYLPAPQNPNEALAMWIVARTAVDPEAVAASIRRTVAGIDADVPVGLVSTMQRIVSDSLALRRIPALLLGVFSVIALVLALVGIYGVVAYNVAQRTQEIGIRMALGARRGDVLRMILRHGIVLAGAGVACGAAAALALTRLMAGLLHGVTATDATTFLGTGALLAAAAVVACWIPARRATRVDPMIALRCE